MPIKNRKKVMVVIISALAFSEKPDLMTTWINGGYFFFRKDFLNYLDKDSNCILEREPLMKLAIIILTKIICILVQMREL